ncbi:MAG: hypothetical protein ACJ76S_08155 [Solirubrobacteraceae bacterium]
MRVVVMGMMGRTPFAGVAWQVLHYLEGFRRLGCEVSYVEDTGDWPYDPVRNAVTDDSAHPVAFIGALMSWLGLMDRWAYTSPDGRRHGPLGSSLAQVYAEADALVNLTGATVLGDQHLGVPARLYLETDPVLAQIEVAQGDRFTIELLEAHTHHFTYAENLGGPDCEVPLERFDYLTTRPPVVLDWWATGARAGPPRDARFTTVSSWEQSGKDAEWRGETYYWSKHREFLKLVDLPRRVSHPLELALACDDDEVLGLLRSHGWRVIDGVALSRDIQPYREYIRGSRAEFTVAKDQYVRLRTGWFSDRSACYLAAGRPVVTQDTGFGRALPTGEGLLAFSGLDDAAEAIEAVAADPRRHSLAAQDIAREHLAAERVVGDLLAAARL